MRTQQIEDALCYISCYEYYSEYQNEVKIVFDYIEALEEKIKELESNG